MLESGSRIGGLMIHEMVGRGAMGEVYRAEQVNLQRPVAVKRIAGHLTDQPGVLARFEREARLVAALNSPHVVQVYEFGSYTDAQQSAHVLLVMEWIDGGRSIRHCMTDNIGMPWPIVARIFEQCCIGLAVAHLNGIIHRDLKPDNFLLSPQGLVKIADFGLANASDSSALTADGAIIGTPNYLSPEACNGEDIDISGDIYSLGASMFHLLTGCPLYSASSTIALLRAHCDQDVPNIFNYLSDLPKEFGDLITHCLQKDPTDRPPSISDILHSLRDLQSMKDTQGNTYAFAPDLLPLVDIANKNIANDRSTVETLVPKIDGSGLPFTVDAHARTTVADSTQHLDSGKNTDNDDTLMAQTEATLIEAHIEADIQKAPTIADNTPEQKKTRTIKTYAQPLLLLCLFIGAVILISASTFLLRETDPIAETSAAIIQALSENDIQRAHSLIQKTLAEHPGEKRAHQLLADIISQESQMLIHKERFVNALEILESHKERYSWLNIDTWKQDVLLSKALDLRKKDRFASENIYIELRKEFPKELRICEAYVANFGALVNTRNSGGATNASMELIKAGRAMTENRAQTLIEGYFYARYDSEWGQQLRDLLLQYHHDPFVAQCIEKINSDRDNDRFHAHDVLKTDQSLSPIDRLRFHLRNVLSMSSSSNEMDASLAWLTTASHTADWADLKSQIDFDTFLDIRLLSNWSDRQKQLSTFIASSIFSEMQKHILTWISSDSVRLRYNAYMILKAADQLTLIDQSAFHLTTLQTFAVEWGAPDDFDQALIYYRTQLTVDRDGTRQILRACKKRVNDYIIRVTAEGHPEYAKYSGANIEELEKLLE